MKPIVAPIRPGDQGVEVANLQTGLIALLRREAIRAEPVRRDDLLRGLGDEQRPEAYLDATKESVHLFQQQHHLRDGGDVDNETAEAFNALLRDFGLLDDREPPDQAEYRVEGRVFSRISPGVGGLRVVIADKGVGGVVSLAETRTDESGAYQVTFPEGEIRRRGKAQPDLEARVYEGDMFLGASEVRYNASRHEVLTVLLPDSASSALRSEHEVLTAALAQHFDGRLGDLKENGERQDITYLANKSGWDARAVALAALSDQFSERTTNEEGIPAIAPALFYALFRAGLPANETALYGAEASGVEAIWKQGIAQGIIPAHFEATVPAALEKFRTLSVRQALDGPALGGLSSLGEMLAISLPDADPAKREHFARLKVEHQGDPNRFWEAVKTNFGDQASRRLRLDGQLAYLTLNNAPLIGKLHAAAAERPLSTPVDLIRQGFHRAEKWQVLIGDERIPSEVPGDGELAKRTNYAEVMAAQLRLSYPTATLAAMVKSGETSTVIAAADKVHDFLLQHYEKFDIGRQSIEQFVTGHQVAIDPDVQREITRIQRVRQITPSDTAMNALLRQGVDSAYAVVRYDRDEFVAAFKDEVGGEAQATLIHAKAQQVHNAVLNIAISYLVASRAPPIGVHSPAQTVNPPPNVPDNVGDVIAYASLEKLLGEMDYCECEHCRSILSPAAYLVDLLQFLDPVAKRWDQFLSQWRADHDNVPYPYTFTKLQDWIDAGSPAEVIQTPLEVLLSRRPDLQYLPLTCENTNTPLPYIDVVNETLEHFVANGLESAELPRALYRRPGQRRRAAGKSAVRRGQCLRHPGWWRKPGAPAAAAASVAVSPATGGPAPSVRLV
jgi:hypothetical protein